MGMNEEILDLNRRISLLNKSKEEAKKLLAVEEHKLGEVAASLEVEGYDVGKMTEEDIVALIAKLTTKFQETKEVLENKLEEAEKLYSKLDEINQKS